MGSLNKSRSPEVEWNGGWGREANGDGTTKAISGDRTWAWAGGCCAYWDNVCERKRCEVWIG